MDDDEEDDDDDRNDEGVDNDAVMGDEADANGNGAQATEATRVVIKLDPGKAAALADGGVKRPREDETEAPAL